MNTNPVIILGSGINALGIVRSLATTNIPIYILDSRKDIAVYSKYVKKFIEIEDKKFIESFKKTLQKFSKHPVIFPTTDFYLYTLLKNASEFKDQCLIPISDWTIVSPLLEKEFLYDLAKSHDIPHPITEVTNNASEIYEKANNIGLPVVIKPSLTTGFAQEIGEKAPIIFTIEKLKETCNIITESSFKNSPMVIQEYIPGEVEDLHTITCYADRNNNIRGYSIGHKIRQSPPITGTIISGKVEHVEAILDAAKKLIKASGFHGISNIEFKYDKRDGKYKLIEINPRTGIWNLSSYKAGINLPLMAYKDCFEKDFENECNNECSLIWMDTPVDLYNTLIGFKHKGHPEYCLSFSQWLTSIKGRKVDAIFDIKDIRPFIHSLIRLLNIF